MTEPTLAQLERIDLAQKLQTIAEANNSSGVMSCINTFSTCW